MAVKVKKPKKDPKDREGKKRPFQDDTALILAAAILLMVAQYYYFSMMQEMAKPKKIVIRVEGDNVARAVSQDLAAQRGNIETHVKNFLVVSGQQSDEAQMARYKPFFSAPAWQSYQQYVATMQKALGAGQSLRAEFTLGSQKYAVLGDDLTGLIAEGLFCFGQGTSFKCGPHGFSLQLMLRGNINQPGTLQFEEWKVMPPRAAQP